MTLDYSILDVIRSMQHSRLSNYIVPGLTSSLLGGEGHGCVRVFDMQREQHEVITPHSHRFDFTCFVLRGYVVNRVWYSRPVDAGLDLYLESELSFLGAAGSYTQATKNGARYGYSDRTYDAGEWYSMTHDQIHSITFSKDALVLFFEGPTVTDTTTILEPIVDGQRVPTFKVEPWMFQRDTNTENPT